MGRRGKKGSRSNNASHSMGAAALKPYDEVNGLVAPVEASIQTSTIPETPGREPCIFASGMRQGHIPSPLVWHKYERWSKVAWDVLKELHLELHAWHITNWLSRVSCGKEIWENVRINNPDDARRIDMYSARWCQCHPVWPLPHVGDPLIYGGFATPKLLSDLQALLSSGQQGIPPAQLAAVLQQARHPQPVATSAAIHCPPAMQSENTLDTVGHSIAAMTPLEISLEQRCRQLLEENARLKEAARQSAADAAMAAVASAACQSEIRHLREKHTDMLRTVDATEVEAAALRMHCLQLQEDNASLLLTEDSLRATIVSIKAELQAAQCLLLIGDGASGASVAAVPAVRTRPDPVASVAAVETSHADWRPASVAPEAEQAAATRGRSLGAEHAADVSSSWDSELLEDLESLVHRKWAAAEAAGGATGAEVDTAPGEDVSSAEAPGGEATPSSSMIPPLHDTAQGGADAAGIMLHGVQAGVAAKSGDSVSAEACTPAAVGGSSSPSPRSPPQTPPLTPGMQPTVGDPGPASNAF